MPKRITEAQYQKKWADYGLCKRTEVDIWFAHSCNSLCRKHGCKRNSTEDVVDRVRSICGICPVREACQKWSIIHLQYGFAGGLTEYERAIERKRHGIRLHDDEEEF